MGDTDMRHAALRIDGMTCVNCQTRIEKSLLEADGVTGATVSWEKGAASVDFDGRKITADDITARIEKLGYKVVRSGDQDGAGGRILSALFYIVIIAGLFVVLQKSGVMNLLVPSSIASSSMSLALLFVTGLLTSVHCVAMCGGITLSQSLSRRLGAGWNVSQADFLPSLLYNLGRVASYTLIGLVLGTAGFFLGGQPGGTERALTLPLSIQGILKLAAGVFMILTGISMLGLFPFLRNITPHLPASLSKRIAQAQASATSNARARNAAPFIVGILNGFMPCGPLQTMWLVALASGHPLYGALSMAVFGAGTVPLMLGLGSVISILEKNIRRSL